EMEFHERELECDSGLVAKASELIEQGGAAHELILCSGELAEVVEQRLHPQVPFDPEKSVVVLLGDLGPAPQLGDRSLQVALEPRTDARGLEQHPDLEGRIADFGGDRSCLCDMAASVRSATLLGRDPRLAAQGVRSKL